MRKGNLFWGVLIIIIGSLMLINQLIPALDLGRFILPAVLILLGLWFLIAPAFFRSNGVASTESLSVPLGEAREMELELHHGAGRLRLAAGSDPGELLSGQFTGEVKRSVERSDRIVRVNLKSAVNFFPGWPNFGSDGLNWDIKLAGGIPSHIIVQAGANDLRFDLQDLLITRLELNTGASSSRINLPDNAGFTRVDVKSGAASVDLRVPENVAARIQVSSGISSVKIDRTRFPLTDGAYKSPDYEVAANRIDIYIEGGVGSFDVR